MLDVWNAYCLECECGCVPALLCLDDHCCLLCLNCEYASGNKEGAGVLVYDPLNFIYDLRRNLARLGYRKAVTTSKSVSIY